MWTAHGLTTFYILFVAEISTRVVHLAGITPHPNSAFMAQVTRNLTDCLDDLLLRKKYLILNRDAKFTDVAGWDSHPLEIADSSRRTVFGPRRHTREGQ